MPGKSHDRQRQGAFFSLKIIKKTCQVFSFFVETKPTYFFQIVFCIVVSKSRVQEIQVLLKKNLFEVHVEAHSKVLSNLTQSESKTSSGPSYLVG